MLRKLLVAQFERNTERYEIETNTPNELEIWDKEERKSFVFKFDNEENLIEIY